MKTRTIRINRHVNMKMSWNQIRQVGGWLALLALAPAGVQRAAAQGTPSPANYPPAVVILNPTNGATLLQSVPFQFVANARDFDGSVAKVDFYSSTQKLGEATNAVYYTTESGSNVSAFVLAVTNLPVGTNLLSAVATDNEGAQGTSAPVRITVVASLAIHAGPVLYDPQHDPYFVQQVTITNPTPVTLEGIRLHIANLTNTPPVTVYNASGTNAGRPYVDTQAPIAPGRAATVTVVYYSPRRVRPNPVLDPELLPGGSAAALPPAGTIQRIHRALSLSNNDFMVEFKSAAGQKYAVEYSSDLVHWKVSQPYIQGSGTWIQWVDFGQPLTDNTPSAVGNRYYRVIRVNP